MKIKVHPGKGCLSAGRHKSWSEFKNERATVRYDQTVARSGTWHDQVPGTIWYLARSDLVPGTIR